MKVKWLVESFDRDNSFEELSQEVKRQGMDCELIKYEPFQSGSIDVYPGEQCVIFQGSINMAAQIQRDKPWIPGPFATWNNYLCQNYYQHYGKWLLNGDYTMLPFIEFVRRKEEFVEKYKDYGDTFFIRPNGGTKSFTGFAFSPQTISDNMWKYLQSETPSAELVLISAPKNIHREWRLICTEDKVLTGSRYKTWGRPDYNSEVPQEAIDKALEILKESKWVPDPIFVMDICDSPTGVYHLLEIGAFSVAGLYKCDMKPIVKVASELALKEFGSLQ